MKTWIRAAVFTALAAVSALVAAQADYPAKPIKFVVPVPPGGAADVMSRMVAEHLQTKWGQTVVVENKPGAGSSLGMDAVAKAAPDGYTIGMGNIAANAINPAVRPGAFPYQPVKDFAAISMVGVTPLILVVNAEKVPAKTLAEFVAYLKANPGTVPYGSSGSGSSLHLGMELLLMRTGTSAIHVPYKGSAPMLTDLLSGQVVASMDAATTSWPHVQTVPGFDVKPWHGVMAPAGTPQAIVDKLSAEIQAFVKMPATQAKLRERGVVPVGSSARDFAQAMNDEFELYKKVVKDAGVKAD
jgi:tripartite-type tricarboxylate transporter receptor subunit TctC